MVIINVVHLARAHHFLYTTQHKHISPIQKQPVMNAEGGYHELWYSLDTVGSYSDIHAYTRALFTHQIQAITITKIHRQAPQ